MDFNLKAWAEKELPLAAKRAETLRVGGGPAYATALENLRRLSSIIAEEEYREERKAYSGVAPVPLGESLIEAGPTPVEPEPDPEPEPEPTEPERPIPKLEDVRGKCGEAKKTGVNIKGILNDLGYKNLSGVDPKDYNTLLDKVSAALEEIG